MNIAEFFKTRKFWTPIIMLIQTAVVYAAPELLHTEITPEVQGMITAFLWSIAGLIVYGDIKFDWINAEVPDTAMVTVAQAQNVNVESADSGTDMVNTSHRHG